MTVASDAALEGDVQPYVERTLLGDLTTFPSYAELARTMLAGPQRGSLTVGSPPAAAHPVGLRLATTARDLHVDGDLDLDPASDTPVPVSIDLTGSAFDVLAARRSTIALRVHATARPLVQHGRPSPPVDPDAAVVVRIRHLVVSTDTVPMAWVTADELAAAQPDPVLPVAVEALDRLNSAHADAVRRLGERHRASHSRAVAIDRYGVTLALGASCDVLARLAFDRAGAAPASLDAAVDAVLRLADAPSAV
ncbi:MAG: hypothetical protein QM733_22610 [Ilumatobacteraceae bacterium]